MRTPCRTSSRASCGPNCAVPASLLIAKSKSAGARSPRRTADRHFDQRRSPPARWPIVRPDRRSDGDERVLEQRVVYGPRSATVPGLYGAVARAGRDLFGRLVRYREMGPRRQPPPDSTKDYHRRFQGAVKPPSRRDTRRICRSSRRLGMPSSAEYQSQQDTSAIIKAFANSPTIGKGIVAVHFGQAIRRQSRH